MKRKPLIAGNWKLNKNISETKDFLKQLLAQTQNQNLNSDMMVIPTFTSLAAAHDLVKDTKILLGAQDLSQYDSGAYTGEVSAEMLKEIGVTHVLIGHSERRQIFKEDDYVINAKVKKALSSKLNPILCCGESLETREANKTDEWINHQIELALDEVKFDAPENLTIAYEPIWAIGTGKTCNSTEANRVIKLIRKKIASLYNQSFADQIRILYGGSVKPDTIEEQMAQSDIDGALVGGASLKVEDFFKIIKNTNFART